MRELRTAVIGLMLASSARLAHADTTALTDVLGPREVAVGEAMRAEAVGSTSAAENPSGEALGHELVFDGSYGYRTTDHASLIGVSACDSTNAAPGCFFYDHIEQDPDLFGRHSDRSTNIAGLSLSHRLGQRLLFGTTVRYFHVSTDVQDESGSSGVNFDLGATVLITSMISVGAVAENLWGSSSSEFPRALGGGAAIRPVRSVSLSFDSMWRTDDGVARYGGGIEWKISTPSGQYVFPLRGGVLHDDALDDTYLSAGLGIGGLSYAIDITGRQQVDGLGNDRMIMASLRVYGPRQ
jgi:hypothetical protein